ncbi:MAG: T9SS type A sorting domain-containing protein [Ignavibacteria bacterium]
MKSINFTLIFIFIFSFELSQNNTAYASNYPNYTPATPITIQQVALNKNNINSWIINTGIFDHDLRTSNTPGFEWPIYTGQDAIFSCGLSIAAMYSGSLRMAAAFYTGEFAPGYVVDSSGITVARTDSRFKIYSVVPTDPNSNDWLHWGDMVPYGAPYTDVNHNQTYEPGIDIPGMPNAAQTIFVCLTDGFSSQHTAGEGFGGGTAPLYAEVHLVAWTYNTTMQDVQFLKWDIYNKSHVAWNSTYFSIVCDPDLGCSDDDFIGCDTTGYFADTARNLGFVYNSQEVDCAGSYRYTAIVPSAGIVLLEGAINHNVNPPVQLKMTSFDYFTNPSAGGPSCETDPNPGANYAYNFMKGLKKDQTPWMFPPGGNASYVTKFCYPGDPETGLGWCEKQGSPSGSVQNCGGPNVYTGNFITSNTGGDRRFLMNSGADNLTVNPGEKQTISVAQMIALGANRRNSVTHLKILCDHVKHFYLIGVIPISDKVPEKYLLYQNYPNPFNPSTIIKYQIVRKGLVNLTVYDAIGRQVETLVSLSQNPGTYEVQWNAAAYPSGVYFYKLSTDGYSETKKLVLLK